jgi:hypothetical protein
MQFPLSLCRGSGGMNPSLAFGNAKSTPYCPRRVNNSWVTWPLRKSLVWRRKVGQLRQQGAADSPAHNLDNVRIQTYVSTST